MSYECFLQKRIQRQDRIIGRLKRAVVKWRLRDKLGLLITLMRAGGVICAHCKTEVSDDPHHWKTCPEHPARKRVEALETAWTKLCAAIVMSPTVVECDRHRNGPVEIDIDHVRQRLIDTYYQLEDEMMVR